jgi:hypothetical protein
VLHLLAVPSAGGQGECPAGAEGEATESAEPYLERLEPGVRRHRGRHLLDRGRRARPNGRVVRHDRGRRLSQAEERCRPGREAHGQNPYQCRVRHDLLLRMWTTVDAIDTRR